MSEWVKILNSKTVPIWLQLEPVGVGYEVSAGQVIYAYFIPSGQQLDIELHDDMIRLHDASVLIDSDKNEIWNFESEPVEMPF